MKQEFTGSLTKFAGAMKDNVPFVKMSIKAKEFGALKAILSPFQEADDGLAGAYNFVKSTGHGNAKYPLVDALHVKVTFDSMEFNAFIVSVSIKKKMDCDAGDCVEYIFDMETDANENTTKFWSSYLNIKDIDNDSELEESVDGLQAVDTYYQEMLSDTEGKPKGKKKKSALIEYNIVFDTDVGEEK